MATLKPLGEAMEKTPRRKPMVEQEHGQHKTMKVLWEKQHFSFGCYHFHLGKMDLRDTTCYNFFLLSKESSIILVISPYGYSHPPRPCGLHAPQGLWNNTERNLRLKLEDVNHGV